MKKKLLSLLTLLLAVCSGAWADSQTFDYSAAGASNNWTQTPITVNGSSGSVSSNQLQFGTAGSSFSVSCTASYALSSVVVTYEKDNDDRTGGGSSMTVSDNNSVTTGYSYNSTSHAGTWTATGSPTSVTFTAVSGKKMRITSVVVNYTTAGGGSGKTALTGAWSDAAPSFTVDDDASGSLPSFTVSGGGTLDTDYTVTYSIVSDASSIVTYTSGGGISAISTSAAATATVRATVTLTETGEESYSLSTTTFDCVITVEEAASLAAASLPHTWKVSDWGVSNNTELTSNTFYDSNTIEIAATSDKKPKFASDSQTIGGTSFTQAVYFANSGAATYNYFHIKVTGPSVITIYARSSHGTNARDIVVYKGSWNNSNLTTISGGAAANGTSTKDAATYTYTGSDAAEFYIAASGGASYFYAITVESALPATPTFDPEAGIIATGDEITIASTRATTIKWQWGSSAVADAEDSSWDSAETYADDNKPAAGAAGSSDNVLSVLAINTYGSAVASATYTFRGASDLAQVNGDKLAVKGTSSTTYTFTKDVDYTTSSDGAITLTSSNSSVATVDGMTLNFVDNAVGLTTVTLTQAATSSYTGSSLTYYVMATGTHVTASSTLDFSDASAAKTMLTGNWNSCDLPYYGNDGTDYYMVFSPFSAYSSNGDTYQTWVNQPKSGSQTPTSLNGTWSATGVFLGNTAYPVSVASLNDSGKAKYVSINATSSATDADNRRARTWHAYQVKGINKAQILANPTAAANSITLAAYEINTGTVASSTTNMNYVTGNTNQVITVDDLDEDKTYLVTVSTDRTSNVYFYEAAFFFDTDLGIEETITPANDKSTYVTRSSMEFSGVSGLKAYVATEATGGNVTMSPVTTVPGGTPLLLIGTASTGYAVPAGSVNATAPATNFLKGGVGAAATFDGTTYDYLLYSDGKFYQIGSGSVAVNKAYLHCDSDPTAAGEARALSILFDDETTAISEELRMKSEEFAAAPVYNLNGQRVAKPQKGLYIVNGKKVIVK